MLNFINQVTMNKIKMYAYYFTCNLFAHLTEMFKDININIHYLVEQQKIEIEKLKDIIHEKDVSLSNLEMSNMLRILGKEIKIEYFKRSDIEAFLVHLKTLNKEELYTFFQNLKNN
jgi:hypothetical protein